MSDNTEKPIDNFVLILGIITSLTGIASNLTQLFNSEHSKALFVIGITLVILYFLIKKFNERRRGERIIILTGIVVVATGALLINLYFYDLFTKNNKCTFEENLISIGVSRFNEPSDNFSLLVYEFLEEENLPDSIYSIKKIENCYFKCISDSSFYNKLDSLCLKSGVLISGKRCSEDELFYCKIRIRNLYNKIGNDSISNKLITFRNPNLHEFSIDYQAEVLVDFVLGILSFSQKDFKKSENLFHRCILNNKNEANVKFLSDCYVFLGDIYSIEQNDKKAINSYLKSYNLNKSDEVLEAIVNAYISQKNYKQAKKYYNKIQNRKEANLESIRAKLKGLEAYYKNLQSSKEKSKTITIPPRGSFSINDTDSTKLTINYVSITQYNFQNRIFFIYKTDKGLYGIFDSHGVLIKLPEFNKISLAKEFIETILK